MRILLPLLILVLAVAGPALAADVWIDVDTALGRPAKDVDDGFALALALRSPELTVRGVSATYGNASLDTALAATRDVLDRFGGAALTVHAGASGPASLGADSPAVRALAAALAERPLTVLALGPLTTVASLLALHPELAPRITRIVAVAGRRPQQRFALSEGHWHTFPDLNFELDPAAAARVITSGVPLVLTPWEAASRVWITPQDLDRLAAAGGPSTWLATRARLWSQLWRWVLSAPGFNPFDTLAVGYVAHPELFSAEPVDLAVEQPPASPLARLTRAVAPQLVARPALTSGALYCARAAPAFHDLLMRTLLQRAD